MMNTLPETNIAPEMDGFPIGISFSRGLFSGDMLVSGRVWYSYSKSYPTEVEGTRSLKQKVSINAGFAI